MQCRIIIPLDISLQTWYHIREQNIREQKTKRHGTWHLVFCASNEQIVCVADIEREARICEFEKCAMANLRSADLRV